MFHTTAENKPILASFTHNVNRHVCYDGITKREKPVNFLLTSDPQMNKIIKHVYMIVRVRHM